MSDLAGDLKTDFLKLMISFNPRDLFRKTSIEQHHEKNLSRFPTRSNTNWNVKPEKLATDLPPPLSNNLWIIPSQKVDWDRVTFSIRNY